MRKWVFSLLLLMGLLALPVGSEANTAPEVKQVISNTLNVKSEASASSKTVMKVKKGNLVIVTATKSDFSKITYNGKTGYISTKGLKAVTPTPKIVTRAQGLVVKATPMSSAKEVSTLQVKTVVEDYGRVNTNYHLVQYGSVTGYAHKSALKATTPTTKYVTAQSLKIFAAANKNSTTRGTLSFSTAVKVHTTIGSWSYVTAGSKRGYVVASSLATTKPVQLKGTKVSYSAIKNDIRYSTTLRDLNGNSVTALFVALNDYYRIATWDDVWAGVSVGDKLYHGHFQLALQNKGSSDVYLQPFEFDSYTYNKSLNLVYRVQGKTAKDTDFLAVSEVLSSAGSGAKLYYYQNGQLKSAGETGYALKPKSIGDQQYQSASYRRDEVTGYIFYTEKFNPTTGKFTTLKEFPFFDDKWEIGAAHAEKFTTIPNYYVK